LEIFVLVFGSLALRIISFSSPFAFGDFATFSVFLMSFPIAPLPFFQNELAAPCRHGPGVCSDLRGSVRVEDGTRLELQDERDF
jgi:hypothetical protein